MEDLIKDDFADGMDINLIKKNLNLIKMVLVFIGIRSILELIDWYPTLTSKPFDSFHSFYLHRISPLVLLVLIILNIICWIFYIRANTLMAEAAESKDVSLFNRGYQFYYRSTRLVVIAVVISIISYSIRIISKGNFTV
ncbi:MAG: hypothetical protein ABJA78_18565 [Ferruginibacter sp.]